MAERIRRHDWSGALGRIEAWPPSLKAAVGFLVRTPVPVALLWGVDGVMIYNDGYARIAGGRHPGILGAKVREAWPEAAAFNGHVLDVVLAGGVLAYKDQEFALERGGEPESAWLDLGYSPIMGEDGKPAGVIAIVIETTDRVLANKQKADEQERLRAFVDATADAVYRMSPDWTEMRQLDGRGFLADTGSPSATWQDAYLLPEDRQAILERINEAIGSKGAFEIEHRVRRADGTVGWTFSRAVPRLNERGDIIEWIGTAADATQTRQVLDALKTSEDRLRLATEAAQVGTWDYDPNTEELRWDARCKALFGLPEGAAVTYEGSFLAGLHPEDRDRTHAAVRAAIEQGQDYDVEYRTVGLRDNVERWIAARGRAIRQKGHTLRFIGTVRDISASKLAARRLEIVNQTNAAIAGQRDLEAIVQLVTDAGVELTGAQFGAFFYNVLNDKGESYMLYTLSGAPRSAFENFPMPRNTQVFAPTFAGEGVVRSDDIKKDPRYGHNAPRRGMPKGHLPVTSYLAVPVVSRSGEVLGGLFFGHEEAARFDEDAEALVVAVANQAAVALDNARLHAAARDANAKLELVNQSLEARVLDEVAARSSVETRERATAEQFRLLVQGVVDYAIYMLDLEGRVSTWNAGAERIKGYAAEDVVGQHFSMFYTPEAVDAREPWRMLEKAREHGRMAMEGWRLRKDGTKFWASVVIDAVWNDEGELIGFAKVTRDITEQKEAARQLESAREALFQAQKMESIGQLTGGIAHDFNNMLAVVIGALSLMQRRLKQGDSNVSRYIESAVEGATRASSLTQRLLAFSRQQPLEPVPLDANKLVASITELVTRTLGEDIQVETVLSPGLWRSFADTVQLESAILNLAVNARDAMPTGGKLTLDTANTLIDSRVAREYAIPEGQYVLIAVSDTGSGMTADVMAQAFDPFFTTKSVGKGSGLGLSQVFGFVRQSGGHIKLYSEPGVGTTVKIYLPRYFGADEPKAVKAASPELNAGDSSEVVLVVEDEERVRNYSVEALKELGYSVIAASGPLEALKLIESVPRIDLLFTDVVMPEMSGRQLADRAIEKLPKLKVLFTTGYTRNAVVHNGVLDPGTSFLQKPFTIDQLAAKVRQVIEG